MFKSRIYSLVSSLLLALSSILMAIPVIAADTDISDMPLASASNSVVKPNVMFILDDSGSMAWSYLGDDVYSKGYVNKVGYRNFVCNKAYYNPSVTYALPVGPDGTPYPAPAFTAAYFDGFRANSLQINLNTEFMAWRSDESSPKTPSGYSEDCSSGGASCDPGSGSDRISNARSAAYYFVYKGTKAANLGDNTSNDDCKNGNTYSANWTKVTVSATSGPSGTDERQNFANWYSYYRTRMLAMKTSAGLAFKNINDNYRIGYTTHSYTGTSAASSSFLKIDDFTYASDGTGHKNNWYAKLYGAGTSGGTPLRSALSKVGRMYAGKLLTGVNDPIQYSCQQNFAILATDGYWNGAAGYQMDGSTAIGNQDGGTTERPMLDSLNKSDTLADVAMYYYKTDLRADGATGALGAGIDVGKNNVPGSGADVQLQQHMTTFTLGLGLNGTLDYSEDYLSGGSADYNKIVQGTLNWPAPVADKPTAIDDLWHAAVNGRGTYFSAQNPTSLVAGLSKALAGVSARTGAAASAATSNLEPVAGDNFLFVALYRTVKWDGDLQARTINPSTGAISTTPAWSAQAELDKKVAATSDTRTIYTYDASAGNKRKNFLWNELTATEKGYFKNACTNNLLSQCPDLTKAQRDIVDLGATLVAFVRGQNGNEDQAGNSDPLYRDREHVLGDMIGAQPVYLKKPTFSYLDENYAAFKEAKKSRLAMVYAAANDGMLHAFEATTGATNSGVEKWAYIPPIVMPNLYKLADKNYAAKHQYYVDGSPSIGDICPKAPNAVCSATEWKTILVGGLNKGGKGYYALDITDPANPLPLWNFTVADDVDMGFSYGNPIITKRRNGTWVVALTSGYNNTSGDGKGHLYILNANTGVVLEKISTTAGSSGTPSGLAKINGWVDTAANNTTKRYYAGDLLGNVWRFDTEDLIAPTGKEATLLAELGNVSPVGIQPITTKPLLSELISGNYSYPIVTVATGRYLGNSDRGDTSQQSVYALKDTLSSTGLGKVRQPDVLVKQTLTTNQAKTERTTSENPVNWNTNSGWYVDLNPNNESPGERVNVEMQQQLGLLTVAGNVPEQNACTVGGYAWLYFFDYRTGQYVQNSTNKMAGRRLTGNALVAGLKTIRLDTGKTVTLVTDTGGTIINEGNPPPPSSSLSGARRISWQELIVD